VFGGGSDDPGRLQRAECAPLAQARGEMTLMEEPPERSSGFDLHALYATRFTAADRRYKAAVWRVLWRRVFSRLVRPDDVVVDVGAGYCEFVNEVVAHRRIAVDLNPAAREFAARGVELHQSPAERMSFLRDGDANVVFASNFLEHLPDKASVSQVVREFHRVLAPGGRLILMGPNIRFAASTYWDFYDHHVPLSDRSVCELLRTVGLELERVESRFLPLTVRTRLRDGFGSSMRIFSFAP
jgi:SAM-dependent methyltransferase